MFLSVLKHGQWSGPCSTAGPRAAPHPCHPTLARRPVLAAWCGSPCRTTAVITRLEEATGGRRPSGRVRQRPSSARWTARHRTPGDFGEADARSREVGECLGERIDIGGAGGGCGGVSVIVHDVRTVSSGCDKNGSTAPPCGPAMRITRPVPSAESRHTRSGRGTQAIPRCRVLPVRESGGA